MLSLIHWAHTDIIFISSVSIIPSFLVYFFSFNSFSWSIWRSNELRTVIFSKWRKRALFSVPYFSTFFFFFFFIHYYYMWYSKCLIAVVWSKFVSIICFEKLKKKKSAKRNRCRGREIYFLSIFVVSFFFLVLFCVKNVSLENFVCFVFRWKLYINVGIV